MADALYQFQRSFAQFLKTPEIDEAHRRAIMPFITNSTAVARGEKGVSLDQRLAIYRNNVLYSLSQALAAQFPVVQRLVGEGFFAGLAREFVCQYPPEEPALTFYGAAFPDFVEHRSDCQMLPYLADVARLELACQHALHAADMIPLQAKSLLATSPEALPDTVLVLHPSACLLQSHWPVQRIYEENLQAEPGEVNIDREGSLSLLVYRKGWEVQIAVLQTPAFVLLQQAQLGESIASAWEAVQSQFNLPDDELVPLLLYLLNLQVFSHTTTIP